MPVSTLTSEIGQKILDRRAVQQFHDRSVANICSSRAELCGSYLSESCMVAHEQRFRDPVSPGFTHLSVGRPPCVGHHRILSDVYRARAIPSENERSRTLHTVRIHTRLKIMTALNVPRRYSKRKTSLIPVLEIPQVRRSEQRLGFCLTPLVAGLWRRKRKTDRWSSRACRS